MHKVLKAIKKKNLLFILWCCLKRNHCIISLCDLVYKTFIQYCYNIKIASTDNSGKVVYCHFSFCLALSILKDWFRSCNILKNILDLILLESTTEKTCIVNLSLSCFCSDIEIHNCFKLLFQFVCTLKIPWESKGRKINSIKLRNN